MTISCPCGGKFKRTDIVPVQQQGKTLWKDTDPIKANWKCDKCGAVRTQRKRQSKIKNLEPHVRLIDGSILCGEDSEKVESIRIGKIPLLGDIPNPCAKCQVEYEKILERLLNSLKISSL